MSECSGSGVTPLGELCLGCPRCDYVAAAAERRRAAKHAEPGMGVSTVPSVRTPPKRQVELQTVLRTIRKYAPLDHKTKEQAALKLGEETGELFRAVLGLEKADGLGYRKITKAELVEECVDVLICLFALAEKYEISDSDIASAAPPKLKKWMAVVGEQQRNEVSDGSETGCD